MDAFQWEGKLGEPPGQSGSFYQESYTCPCSLSNSTSENLSYRNNQKGEKGLCRKTFVSISTYQREKQENLSDNTYVNYS